MSYHKNDELRKDDKATLKITRAGGKFIEALAAQLHKRGKVKQVRNKNAAMQCCIDHAMKCAEAHGWSEVIDD